MGILDNLPHRAHARVRTRTADGLGGGVDSYTYLFTNRPCWQQMASDREIREFGKRGVSVTNKVYFTSDPQIDERHTLVIGADTFEVRSRSKPDASVGLGIVWRVMVEETTTGSTSE